MTDLPPLPPALVERVARAYDREDSDLCGEQDPWSVGLNDPDFEEWKSERRSCAEAALNAMLEGITLEWRNSYGVWRAETPWGDYKLTGTMLGLPLPMNPVQMHSTEELGKAAALHHLRTTWLKMMEGG